MRKHGNHFSKHFHLETGYYNQLYCNTAPVEGCFYGYYNKVGQNVHGSFFVSETQNRAQTSKNAARTVTGVPGHFDGTVFCVRQIWSRTQNGF